MVFVTVHVLCPLVAVVIAVNPACIVLGLYHKDSVGRDYDVVNLYRVAIALQHDVVPHIVFVGQMAQDGGHPLFATLAAIFGLAWQQLCEVVQAYDNRNRQYGK